MVVLSLITQILYKLKPMHIGVGSEGARGAAPPLKYNFALAHFTRCRPRPTFNEYGAEVYPPFFVPVLLCMYIIATAVVPL